LQVNKNQKAFFAKCQILFKKEFKYKFKYFSFLNAKYNYKYFEKSL